MSADALGLVRIAVLKMKGCLIRLRALSERQGSRNDEPRIETLLISARASPIGEERRLKIERVLDARSYLLSPIDACFPPDSESMDEAEQAALSTMSQRVPLGARACFLSHRRAWKKASKSTAALTVILEDDAVPLYRRRPYLRVLPEDLDVLHLHHFAQYLPSYREAIIELARARFSAYSMDDVVNSHCGQLYRAAMPNSAYAVTPRGATKLLNLFEEVGLYWKHDSIMLRHSLSDAMFERMRPLVNDSTIVFYSGQSASRAGAKKGTTRLNTYCIYPPWFIHDYETASIIKSLGN